jgi:hypothetical protein
MKKFYHDFKLLFWIFVGFFGMAYGAIRFDQFMGWEKKRNERNMQKMYATHLDFHLDTHSLVENTDYGRQEEARQESEDKGVSITTDDNGQIHVYENGDELA